MFSNDYDISAKGNIVLKNNSFSVKILEKTNRIINDIWNKELEKNHSIFNEQVLCLKNFFKKNNEVHINVFFTDYRNVIAERKYPSLRLNIKQIGVSGIIILNENHGRFVIFSKRSKNNMEYPKYLELVPSGNIDKSVLQNDNLINYIQKLKEEFTEETGTSEDSIKKIYSFCLVYDKINHVFDVGCIIELSYSVLDFIKNFQSVDEYSNPIFVKEEQLNDFIIKNREKIVPSSLALLDCYLFK